jgi:hypothetical protein
MIAWIVGIVTLLLLLFVFWRGRSRAFRERTEEPKYLFLESLGIPAPRKAGRAKPPSSEEKKDESTKS